ncbi:MAG TPA: asparagine--tRNA ligase, partial [Clostridiales bacterium]|nr:asparagine--tRNA ligase [Clostridiales bacterium]
MSIKKELTRIADLYANAEAFAGQTIKVGGWIRSLRSSNVFGFIELNDGTYFKSVQVVFEEQNLDNYKNVAKQNTGASLMITGTLMLTPDSMQPFEIKAAKIEICGTSTPDYPLQPKKHSLEFLRSIAHLRPRSNTFNAVFRVRSCAAQAIHRFFSEKGFVYVNTPIITASDCEGAGEMFKVTTLDIGNPPRTESGETDFSKDFFAAAANLTVSGQLEAECFAMAFSNVYTFGPTFRAENSNTTRHAAEFWMIEPEIAFADLSDYMDLAEEMTKYVIGNVLESCRVEIEFFNKFIDKSLFERLNNLVSSDFGRITYTEAINILKESGQKFDFKVEWGCDLQTEHERYLTEK